jgi:RNA-binding protein
MILKKNRVGAPIHFSTSSGNLIIRSEVNLNIGDPIFNCRGKRIGIVFDIFGPVKAPFISIKPKNENPEKLVGEPLFVNRFNR